MFCFIFSFWLIFYFLRSRLLNDMHSSSESCYLQNLQLTCSSMLTILLVSKIICVPGNNRKGPFSQIQVNLALPVQSSPKPSKIQGIIVLKTSEFYQPPHRLLFFSSLFHNASSSLLLNFSYSSASFKSCQNLPILALNGDYLRTFF